MVWAPRELASMTGLHENSCNSRDICQVGTKEEDRNCSCKG